jgi:ketosteroid isomerase-like protein
MAVCLFSIAVGKGDEVNGNIDYRRFAAEFCTRYSSEQAADVLGMYAEDATMEVIVRPDLLQGPMAKNKQELARFLDRRPAGMGPRLLCKGYIVDENRIVVEAVGDMNFGDGYVYANRYAFVLEMRDDKIVRMREYMDTLYAKEAFDFLAKRAGPTVNR